jgi:hypothetical protein
MTPTNLFGFIFFCIFLAPGIFYNHLRAARAHNSRETQLEELGRILITSASISMISSALAAIFLKLPHFPSLSFRELLANPKDYIPNNIFSVLLYMSMVLVIGVLLSFLTNYSLVTLARLKRTSVHQWQILFNNVRAFEEINFDSKLRRFWRKFLIRILPKSTGNKYEYADELIVIPVVRVTTPDSRSYIGMVDLFSEHENVSERELIVSPVPRPYIQFLPEEWRNIAIAPPEWRRMHLSGSAINTIEVLHWEFPK